MERAAVDHSPYVRDPLAAPDAVLAARRRPMSECLELALSWNAAAAELRAGLLAAPIAHRDDLLKMKRAAGRPQDLADVRLLEALDEEP
jgi:hypothetical protein